MTKFPKWPRVTLIPVSPGKQMLDAMHAPLLDGVRLELRDTRSLVLVMIGDEVHWPATRFLTWMSIRSASRTGDTVRTYAESLRSYLNYLIDQQTDLETVSERTLQAYRNWLVDINEARRRLSPATVNLRLTAATLFHSWCEREGVLSSTVSAYLALNTATSKFPNRSSRSVRRYAASTLHVRNPERLPRILSRDELQLVIKQAGEPYGLMFKWAVTTGMRRFELCNLTIKDLPPIQEGRGSRLREMSVYRKGGSFLKIFVPNALVDETWSHIQFGRGVVFPSSFVFLSRTGLPVQRGHLSKVFKQSCSCVAPGATLHHLRHTYAVVLLTLLQQRAAEGESINPLKALQVMMGHASLDTTEIYLRALDVHSEAVEQTLYYLYGGAIESA